jgi:hypothetical protein
LHGVRGRQLLRDLEAGVPAADDQHGARGHVVRPTVVGAVRLEDLLREVRRLRRDPRHLERPGGDDDLVGLDAAVAEVDDEPTVLRRQRPRDGAGLDRQRERRRVVLQVGDDLVPGRIPVGIAREVEPREGVVAARREEDERLPAVTPGRAHAVAGLENREPSALSCEVVADRETRLAAADHGDLQALGRSVRRRRPRARARVVLQL